MSSRVASIICWGSNTDVGKTLVSAALARAAKSLRVPVCYVKPVQTGFGGPVMLAGSDEAKKKNHKEEDSLSLEEIWTMDGTKVAHALSAIHRLMPHAAAATSRHHQQLQAPARKIAPPNFEGVIGDRGGDRDGGAGARVSTFFGWKHAVSPHLAVEMEGRPVSDEEILRAIEQEQRVFHDQMIRAGTTGLMLIETAGGPLSPAPSGTLFADLLRPLRWPGVLVGSGALGGITTTLCAKEAIEVRGLDIAHLLLLEDEGGGEATTTTTSNLNNKAALEEHVPTNMSVTSIQPIEPKAQVQDSIAELDDWLCAVNDDLVTVVEDLMDEHSRKLSEMQSYPSTALDTFWYPFAQHKTIEEDQVTVIDSRKGNHLRVYDAERGVFSSKFDSCASWWTQGPDLSMQTEMGKRLGYACSRYGHVIFPTNVHEPVLECTKNLLQGPGKEWADRVFYSDNGSTAIEVALKMAFRKYLFDTLGSDCLGTSNMMGVKEEEEEEGRREMLVVTQKGGYHGDTLACMNAVEKSVFNGYFQFPWNEQKCVALQPAYIKQNKGYWMIELPDGYLMDTKFKYVTDYFKGQDRACGTCRDVELQRLYQQEIERELGRHENLGALLIEPVCQGAGGMKFIDPLWQRTLIDYCRGRSIPVIFDEIFVGLYRCGVESTRQLLERDPDISCYGKLLTGGTVPLGVTLAREDVFDCFLSDQKADALLHGHSYTANPIGCSASNFAFEQYNSVLKQQREEGAFKCLDYWDVRLTRKVSNFECVKSAIGLGTILSVELAGEAGYTSTGLTDKIIQSLQQKGVYCRPLGNVLYMMCSPFTPKKECDELLEKLVDTLAVYVKVLRF
jgi:dethiobiotin synthetase/adenosylmethionine--8-amino-7-oxononanoate aminotransferase